MGRPQQSYYDHLLLGKTKNIVFDVLQRLNAQRGVPFAQELAAIRHPGSSASASSSARVSGSSSSRRKPEYSFEQFTEDLDGSNSLVQRIVETLIKETALQAHITHSTAARAATEGAASRGVRSVRSPSPTAARRFSVYNPTSSARSRRSRRTLNMFAPAVGADVALELSGSDNEDGASVTSGSSATPEPSHGSVARALELEHLQNQSSTARQLAASAQANATAALRSATSTIPRRPVDITSLQRAQRRAEAAQAQAEFGELDAAYSGIFSSSDPSMRSRRTALFENSNNDEATSSAVSEAMESMDRGLMARLDAMRASHSRLSYLQSASNARESAARREASARGATVDASTNTTTSSGASGSGTATYLGRGRSTFLPHGAARAARLAIPMPPPAASALDSAESAAAAISERAQHFRIMSAAQRAASRIEAEVTGASEEPARQSSSAAASASTSTAAVAPGADLADANIIPARGGEAYTPAVHDARLRRGSPLPEAADWQRLQSRLTEAMCDAFSMLRQDMRVSSDEARRLLNQANAARTAEGPQGGSYVGELSCLVEPDVARELDATLEAIAPQPTLMQSNARRWMAQASWAWAHALRIVEGLPARPVRAAQSTASSIQREREAAALSRTTWLALQDYYDWAVAQETRTMEREVGMERVIAALSYLCDRFGYDPDVEEINARAATLAETQNALPPLQLEAQSLHARLPFSQVLAALPPPPPSVQSLSAQAQAQPQAAEQRRVAPLPPRARDASSSMASSSSASSPRRPPALTPWAASSGSSGAAPQERERRVDERLATSAASAVEEADRALR